MSLTRLVRLIITKRSLDLLIYCQFSVSVQGVAVASGDWTGPSGRCSISCLIQLHRFPLRHITSPATDKALPAFPLIVFVSFFYFASERASSDTWHVCTAGAPAIYSGSPTMGQG